MREPVPVLKRPLDIAILVYFLFNILFVSYLISLEQIVIDDPSNFDYPFWPPAFVVDLIHWWGRNFDPALMARPVWWRVTIWIDALFFGPFYIVAIYAYIKGKDWIRIPSIIYASVMITGVSVILGEEFFGPHVSPEPWIVFLVNSPWFLFPLIIIYRMWRHPHPFNR